MKRMSSVAVVGGTAVLLLATWGCVPAPSPPTALPQGQLSAQQGRRPGDDGLLRDLRRAEGQPGDALGRPRPDALGGIPPRRDEPAEHRQQLQAGHDERLRQPDRAATGDGEGVQRPHVRRRQRQPRRHHPVDVPEAAVRHRGPHRHRQLRRVGRQRRHPRGVARVLVDRSAAAGALGRLPPPCPVGPQRRRRVDRRLRRVRSVRVESRSIRSRSSATTCCNRFRSRPVAVW